MSLLELFVAARAWDEAQQELNKRVSIIAGRAHLSENLAAELLSAGIALAHTYTAVVSKE